MKSYFIGLSVLSIFAAGCGKKATSADASLESTKNKTYSCHGSSPAVTVVLKEYTNGMKSAMADVTVTPADGNARTFTGLSMFIDDEGGFDYGVSNSSIELLIVLPPNELPGKQVAARYRDLVKAPNKTQNLVCTVK